MWLLVSAVTVYFIMLILCLCQVFSLLCVAQGAPQYGGGVSQPARQPAPAQSSPQVSCRTEYAEVWDTEYVETETQECQTVQVKQCSTQYQKQCVPKQRQECNTVYKTEYEEVCSQQYRDETEYYTETECSTDYKQDCEYQWEGTGNNKVWAPIQGTCKNNAYDKCGDVQKERVKQVPYNDCRDVPRQVPSQECRTVTEQSCSQVPYQNCQNVPKQECRAVHKKVPKRVSRRVPKKVCDDGGSYGAVNRQAETVGTGGVKIRSDAPEKQVKLKTGDAVNFGR